MDLRRGFSLTRPLRKHSLYSWVAPIRTIKASRPHGHASACLGCAPVKKWPSTRTLGQLLLQLNATIKGLLRYEPFRKAAHTRKRYFCFMTLTHVCRYSGVELKSSLTPSLSIIGSHYNGTTAHAGRRPASGSSMYGSASTAATKEEGHYKHDQKHHEQNLGDTCSCARNTAKTQYCSNDGDD